MRKSTALNVCYRSTDEQSVERQRRLDTAFNILFDEVLKAARRPASDSTRSGGGSKL